MSLNLARVEALNKGNYDTWRMQVEALLIKDDLWQYVSGEITKPEIREDHVTSINAHNRWIIQDRKAKSDLILSISPSELKQLKNCETAHETWIKLENIYASKGPARKATLLKQLTLQKMQEEDDVRNHINKFFDAVDKLGEMNVDINADLLSIMLLYSLPSSYENFRCAIESRDKLPDAEALKIKILEESDARKQNERITENSNAMWIAERNNNGEKYTNKTESKGGNRSSNNFSGKLNKNKTNSNIICFRCNKRGHIASKCYSKLPKENEKEAKLIGETFFTAVANIKVETQDNKWCLDSGCTAHLCKNKNSFQEMETLNGSLHLANKYSTDIKAKGKVMVKMMSHNDEKIVNLEDTLWVPDLRTNLMSVAKIVDKGNEIIFKKNVAMIKGLDGKIKIMANRIGNLYYIKQPDEEIAQTVKEQEINLKLWHDRMGHLNEKDLIQLLKKINVNVKIHESNLDRRICALGKQTCLSFKSTHERAKTKLEIIHSDVCGPFRERSKGGAKYFCSFIDDHTRYCVVYLLQNKNEVFGKFKEYKQMVENMCENKIKYLQTDNGKEYCNTEFDKYLRDNGIQRRLSVPYTPQQNGVAERKNRTLLDMARCMLLNSEMENNFWGEAILMANHIRNRSPTSSLNKEIPYEKWFGKRVNINYFRVFGTKTYIVDERITRGKMDQRSKEGYLVGYSEQCKAYRIYLPQMEKVVISRDVKFSSEMRNEKKNNREYQEENNNELLDITIIPRLSNINNTDEIQENDEEESINPETRLPGRPKIVRTGKPGRPKKVYKTHNEMIPTIRVNDVNAEDDALENVIANNAEISLRQAMESNDSDEWRNAITSEFKSLIENNTWEVVTKPKNENIIKCRMVLANKMNSKGDMYKRKARLVAKGFSQKEGYDYTYTFAPVARFESLRILLAVSVQYNLILHQIDVASAFLNGKLDEDIYMEVPELFEDSLIQIIREEKGDIKNKATQMLNNIRNKFNCCCKLKKALYGLKQASRQWNMVIDSKLKMMGLKQNKAEPCIYCINEKELMIIVLVYVDDILIAGNQIDKINEIKLKLSKDFEITDMGETKFFLGVEIMRKDNEITIIQRRYIRDLLKRFKMEDANGIDTPGNVNENFELNNETYEAPYRELIGGLMYLAVVTRPDIINRVVHLAQFMTNFNKEHWIAAKRILRYVKKTSDFGLSYKKDNKELNIVGYTDADWGGDIMDRKSYTGYVFNMCNGAITWKSQKQKTVALSSAEAEYISIAEAAKEAIYIKNIFNEMNLKANIKLYNDNQSANLLTRDAVYHARSKHIDLRYHFVRDAVKNEDFKLEYLPTEKMIADVFTKSLSKSKHEFCRQGVGLKELICTH